MTESSWEHLVAECAMRLFVRFADEHEGGDADSLKAQKCWAMAQLFAVQGERLAIRRAEARKEALS